MYTERERERERAMYMQTTIVAASQTIADYWCRMNDKDSMKHE